MLPLFPPWHFSRWTAIDDRVRGGSSRSHLDPVPVASPHDAQGDEKKVAARFWGTLDIKTLGGAGFASQRYQFGPEPIRLPPAEYRGVTLTLLPASPSHHLKDKIPQTFTLVLKNAPSPPRTPGKPRLPPSPEPASLSFEHDFTAPAAPSNASATAHAGKEGVRVNLAFDDFAPTYRGRTVRRDDPRWAPLDSEAVYELSVMCRSGFGKQEGDFELVLRGMEGWARAKEEREVGVRGKAREGCWGWLGRLWGESQERGVRLVDDEKK